MLNLMMITLLTGCGESEETKAAAPAPEAAESASDKKEADGEASEARVAEELSPMEEPFNPALMIAPPISASSTLAPQGQFSFELKNLVDMNHKTAWVEGAEGPGIGESVSFNMMPCKALVIANGYQHSDAIFDGNNRVKTLKFLVEGEHVANLNLEDRQGLQFFPLTLSEAKEVTLEIAAVYGGGKWPDTALSGVSLHCDR